MSLVIADAGPLIALSRIERLELLKTLFNKVVITDTIRDEVLDNRHERGKTPVRNAIETGWISVIAVDQGNWKPINPGVDAGESSAIFLARQSPDSTLLIMDDQAGRAEARYHHLAVIGVAAVIGIARERGLINSAKDLLNEMRHAGYYIGESVIEVILKEIGEI